MNQEERQQFDIYQQRLAHYKEIICFANVLCTRLKNKDNIEPGITKLAKEILKKIEE